MKKLSSLVLGLLVLTASTVYAQSTENVNTSKFKQLKEELATPNVYRTASGAPGHKYWQQKANYNIKVTLDDKKQSITGEEEITYINNSPDQLDYLWIQLDQNMRAKDSDTKKIRTASFKDKMSFRDMKRMHSDFDGGFKLTAVKDKSGKDLNYVVNNTMMRVDLPSTLKAGGSYTFKIKWWYNINDRMKIGGRSGYEYFKEEDNYLYTIAQFFPRMCVYNEVEGWQNKQFLGSGEFTLPFGDYTVSITTPKDHIVGATGELQNASSVLTPKQRERFKKAKSEYETPVMIVTQEEAEKAEKEKMDATKTWVFSAKNVRDFAFCSSRKFIWDAMSVKVGSRNVLAMSYYPKEGNPLWEEYSTKVVAHTVKTYSKFTCDYTYPVAISVHTKWIGMEYPMICFNGGRPNEDGTYSKSTKYGMIGVIIHEVGHNFFPMIINSDERQWTWMDEGLNTFVQYLTEQEWERGYPSRRGPANKIVPYMKGDKTNITPIMTNSESLNQFGNNAYAKPATALNILRETVMGRELFDFAFKTYCERWKFKHPTPADLFRTMEDASGVDLDWYWRGWFYSTDHVDVSMDKVTWYKIDSKNPEVENPIKEKEYAERALPISEIRNDGEKMVKETYSERDPRILDFYNKMDPFEVTVLDKDDYKKYLSSLEEDEKAILDANRNYYQIDFTNKGGLVMPLIIEFVFTDGSREVRRIPAEVWARNNTKISKIFYFNKEVRGITLDPFLEMADTDVNNNFWPPQMKPTRFQLFKNSGYSRYGGGGENPMQKAKKAKEAEAEKKKDK